MGIQIHPEAAKRLDELANQLLARVAPAPQSMPATEHFRPDIYPVAHINEQDILGELQVTESIIDGTGAEVGRVFEHENRRWALIGQDFKSFLRLTLRLHDIQGLRETTSVEFIRDTAFEWLEAKYKNLQPDSLTEFVLKKAEDEIKDFEIWFPLHRTYLESSFPIGPVVFRTIIREMMDECEARLPKPDPETAANVQLAFARDRSAVQGCAAAATKIRAERSKAIAMGREQAENAVALLRFFSPANWTPKLRSYCTLLGSENLRRRAELFLQGNSIVTYHSGLLDKGAQWVLSNSDLASYPGILDRLQVLSAAPNKTAFRQKLYDALLIYSRNSIAIEPADKLVYILVAIESILLRNENEPLGKNVGERLAFLMGESKEKRIKIKENAVEIYGLRSAFIHHGHSIEDLDLLATFMCNAWTGFNNGVLMPRPVTMPIANDKRRRPERTEAIRILKPVMSNIPKRVSATVAAHANDTVNELGKRDITAPVYSTK
jgi:hypothetical protein